MSDGIGLLMFFMALNKVKDSQAFCLKIFIFLLLLPSALFVLNISGVCAVFMALFRVSANVPSRHAAVLISGTELARQLHREIQRDVEELVAQGNMRPHLGVVLVGDDPASRTYVRNKTRAASILGQI